MGISGGGMLSLCSDVNGNHTAGSAAGCGHEAAGDAYCVQMELETYQAYTDWTVYTGIV